MPSRDPPADLARVRELGLRPASASHVTSPRHVTAAPRDAGHAHDPGRVSGRRKRRAGEDAAGHLPTGRRARPEPAGGPDCGSPPRAGGGRASASGALLEEGGEVNTS